MIRMVPLIALIVAVGLLAKPATSQEKKVEAITGWGEVIDSAGDCKITEKDGKVTIEVPGKLHDLNPRGGRLGRMGAPRILQEVEGDFTVQVKVSADFDPGNNSVSRNWISFQSAGLLLWENEKNYLRLERNVWVTAEGRTLWIPPLLEYFKDGKNMGTNPPTTDQPFFKDRFTYLRLERAGANLSASISHDGNEWIDVKTITTELSQKIKVGVVAIQTSTTPFNVEFEEFKLTKK